MPNPPLLPCDTDALIQIIITHQLKLLRELKRKYAIQACLAFEVENELRQNKKYRPQIQPQLDKALGTGALERLTEASLHEAMNIDTQIPPAAIRATWASIQSKGAEFNIHVGLGEAYTHAAAVTLELPSLSNDNRAIHSLENQGFQVPSPVLRAFDIIALHFQIGTISGKDCEEFRTTLLRFGEGMPPEFQNKSFVDGLSSFSSRLLDNSVAAVGKEPSGKHPHARLLLLQPNS